jgi:hypothetical protein
MKKSNRKASQASRTLRDRPAITTNPMHWSRIEKLSMPLLRPRAPTTRRFPSRKQRRIASKRDSFDLHSPWSPASSSLSRQISSPSYLCAHSHPAELRAHLPHSLRPTDLTFSTSISLLTYVSTPSASPFPLVP